MKEYSVYYTSHAKKDFDDAIQYIKTELKSPETAQKMARAIRSAINDLAHMPHKYAIVEDERLAALGYRKLSTKNYITFFTIDEETKTVNVNRILYARRNWLHIL